MTNIVKVTDCLSRYGNLLTLKGSQGEVITSIDRSTRTRKDDPYMYVYTHIQGESDFRLEYVLNDPPFFIGIGSDREIDLDAQSAKSSEVHVELK